ncbi:hypothetical protein [Enterobacter mori]|uniref:hypothetical protein n=1 Tax=Enterobacter mori TaxID=539813 RepID=UPI003B83C5EA
MKFIYTYTLSMIFLSANAYAGTVHERHPENGGTIQDIQLGDSCNGNGRVAFLENINVKQSLAYVVCKQVAGHSPTNTSFVLSSRLSLNEPPIKRVLGCTVENGTSTGYKILWFQFGTYLPEDIKNAESTLIVERSSSDKTGVVLNGHKNKSILIDYAKNGKIYSNYTVDKDNRYYIPPGATVVRAKYSFPYIGNMVPCYDN